MTALVRVVENRVVVTASTGAQIAAGLLPQVAAAQTAQGLAEDARDAAAADAVLTAADRVQTGLDRDATGSIAGVSAFYDTKAAADAALAGLADLATVMVFVDESQGNARTVYRKQSGAYALKANLSSADSIAHTPSGTGAQVRSQQTRNREVVHVTDYGSLAEAVAAVPAGSAIYCPPGYTHTVTSTISISKDVTIFARNWRGVTITGPANAPIFEGVAGVTNFVLEGITWAGGAGTSQLLRITTANAWPEGKTKIISCKINNFGNFAIERGDSTYLTEIRGNRFDNCVGCISEGWAADSVIDDNLFNDAMAGNPVMRIVGGSRTVITSNDFIRAAGTIATEADIELNPNSSFGRGGRVFILHNKFGGELETPGRPKIRTYNATAQNRSTDVVFAYNQCHGALFSEGGTTHCFQFDNPIAGWVVEGNEFDDFDLIVQDNVANFEGFLGSNKWGDNRYFWSSRRSGQLFLNGGRMFTDVEEKVFGYQRPKVSYEPREARNRVEYSSAITSWNKSAGVTITSGQSDPDGGTNAFLVESDGTSAGQSISRRVAATGIGETAILKLRLKAGASKQVLVGIRDTTVSPSRWVGMIQTLILDDVWRDYEFTIAGINPANVNSLTFYPSGSASLSLAGGFHIYQPQLSDYDSDYIPTPSNEGVVDATIGRRFTKKVSLAGGAKATLPTYADNAAALSGGLLAGDIYKTAAGDLKTVV